MKVKSIRRDGTRLFVMFETTTYVGSNDYLYNFRFYSNITTPPREILKHKANISTGTSDIVLIHDAYATEPEKDTSGLVNYCYKLNSNNLPMSISGNSSRIFIPADNFSSNY